MFGRLQRSSQKCLLRTVNQARKQIVPISVTSVRHATIEGAPPISCRDLYEMPYAIWPRLNVQDRPAQEQFDVDTKLHEFFCYLNGALFVPKDDRSRDAGWNLTQHKCLVDLRDASDNPDLLKVLKEKSGSDELPQLYHNGKCVLKGKDFDDPENIKKALQPGIRPWPRTGPYYNGFQGYEGITESTKLHCGKWKPKVTQPGKYDDRESPRPGKMTDGFPYLKENKK